MTLQGETDALWGKRPDFHCDQTEKGQYSDYITLSLFFSLYSVMLLEFQWGPNRGMEHVCQQRRRALLQRSSHRVEEMKAKRALRNIQPAVQAPPEARGPSKARGHRPADGCKAKSEPRHQTDIKTKEGRAEQHQSTMSGLAKQKNVQLPAPGIGQYLRLT